MTHPRWSRLEIARLKGSKAIFAADLHIFVRVCGYQHFQRARHQTGVVANPIIGQLNREHA